MNIYVINLNIKCMSIIFHCNNENKNYRLVALVSEKIQLPFSSVNVLVLLSFGNYVIKKKVIIKKINNNNYYLLIMKHFIFKY